MGGGVRALTQKLACSEDWQQGTDGQEEKGNMTRMCSYAKISKGGAGSADELRDSGIIILCITRLSRYQNFDNACHARLRTKLHHASETSYL